MMRCGCLQSRKKFQSSAACAGHAKHECKHADFSNYVNAMNQVQEKVAAVIHNNDLNDLDAVTQQAMQAPVPDARAAELRSRLLVILSKLAAAAAAASPPPQTDRGRPPMLDQKLIDEYNEWRKEYDEWLKGAVKDYTQRRKIHI